MAGNGNRIPSVADVVRVGRSPAIHDPARLFELWDGKEDWGYRTAVMIGERAADLVRGALGVSRP